MTNVDLEIAMSVGQSVGPLVRRSNVFVSIRYISLIFRNGQNSHLCHIAFREC